MLNSQNSNINKRQHKINKLFLYNTNIFIYKKVTQYNSKITFNVF